MKLSKSKKTLLTVLSVGMISSFLVVGVTSYANTLISTKASISEENMLLGASPKEWESANLREWLNSDKTNVDYTALPPSYKNEAGFLSDNNFTQNERDAIAVTKHGGAWQYSLSSNINNTLYISQRGVAHNDYFYNDKVFILNFTDLVNYVERNKELFNLNKKYYSNYIQNTTNKQDKYNYIINSGYYNGSYLGTHEMYSSDLKVLRARYENNIVPALSLKPDYLLSNGVIAKNLDVGQTVSFGIYNGEPIKWQVINISDEGYPLLWSTRILTTKEYDAQGDKNPTKSNYINYDSYDVDIASGTGQNKSWETDEKIMSTPVITIENESVLTTPTNDTSITIKIKVTDTNNSIRRIILPDGSIVNGEEAEYVLPKNGEYDIIAENSQGVMTVRHIITKAINTPAEVTITTDKESDNKWTNKPVTVNVRASNNGVYTTVAKAKTGNGSSNSTPYPDWMSLGGKKFRVTGTLTNAITDEDIEKYNLNMNANVRIRISMRQYTINSIGMTYPLYKDITLRELKEKGEIHIDEVYTIPSNAYTQVKPYLTLMDGNSDYTIEGYKFTMSDFTFEILDKDDLAIEEITLPDGNVVNSDTATYKIFKAGSYTFSARDNRNKVTSKTIDLAIDMDNPECEIIYNKELTEDNIVLQINATDELSGIKSIKLPNGEYRTNSVDEKPLSITYNIIQNGTYTFEILDFAGNKITKTITINNIDKEAPTLTYTLNPSTWTNDVTSINVVATDTESGVKEIILPNGSIVKSNTASYTVNANGVYFFKAVDYINHATILKVTVTNIDKKKPTTVINNNKNWTNKDVEITITATDE